jgi:acyl-CoA synthetase (AMP-forming)/AMP-acid ligase II
MRDVAGAVGHVTPGMDVEIVDEADRPVPPGQRGLVRIRGDYMISGYVDEAQSPSQIFRNGWFYPGDIGSLTADGILVISGRQTAVLNLGGEKIAPEAIEEVVAAFDAALLAAAALIDTPDGFGQIWVALESRTPVDLKRLDEHCRRALPDMFSPKRFVIVDRLPRNALGKIERPELRRMLEAEAMVPGTGGAAPA